MQQLFLGAGKAIIPSGQQLFDGSSAQSTNWTVPAKVTAISAVAVGAGGNGSQGYVSSYTHGGTGGNGGNLAYSNDIAVTPGETLVVISPNRPAQQSGSSNADGHTGDPAGIKRGSTWILRAMGGKGGDYDRINATWNIYNETGTGSQTTNIGDVVRIGGLGGCRRAPSTGECFCGGGGAAGYSGGGGDGAVYVGGSTRNGVSSGAGSGGGGGGGGVPDNSGGCAGGGVGLLGEGSSGAGRSILYEGAYWSWGNRTYITGAPGSGGDIGYYSYDWTNYSHTEDFGGWGGKFGGGAGGQKNKSRNDWGRGGAGGVRIIYGTGRAYPSTRTADE